MNYRLLFELSPIGLTLSRMNGDLVDINGAFARIIGRCIAETLKLSYWDITPESYAEKEYAQLECLRKTGTYGPYEKEYIHQNGHLVPVRLHGVMFERDGEQFIWSSVEDITDRRRAEAALQESEKKYRELVENANSIILHWTPEGRIIFLNEFGQKFFGYEASEIIGHHVIGTIVPETESTGRDLRPLMEAIQADPKKFENNINENVRRNGQRVWIAWTNKVVLDKQGRIREILSIGTDISERKKAEEELRQLTQELEQRIIRRTEDLQKSQQDLLTIVEDLNQKTAELEQANLRLQDLDRLKSMFIASMSHELRTPLNSIIGFTGIILQGLTGDINPEQRKQLSIVKESARHLLALINDIIDLNKIEAGVAELSLEGFDLPTLVLEVKDSLEINAAPKALRFSTTLPESLPIISDRRRIRQILVNLMGNAVKFTEEGTIHLSAKKVPPSVLGAQSQKGITASPDTPKSGKRGDFLEISVADTGRGILEKDLDRLFKPFSQITSKDQPKQIGTGLGLYLSQKIAHLLGGEIQVESGAGKGSVFTLRIPILTDLEFGD
jgi:PAS domain S-box-containing protein